MPLQSWANQFQRYMHHHPAISGWLSGVWVLGLSSIVYLWHLGSVGLVDETEPLFAEAARQMTVTGDWITPMFNGETRFDKPPLIYWLMAIAYKILGVNEWSVRLPSALAAIALTGMVFWVLLKFAPFPSNVDIGVTVASEHPQPDPDVSFAALNAVSSADRPLNSLSPTPEPLNWIAAWTGTALLCLHPLTLIWARTGVSDMLLSACMGIATLSFFIGYAQPELPQRQTRWYVFAYAMVALAVLTKGPIGVVIPGLTLGLFMLYLGNGWQLLREMRLVLGSLIILAISVPWFLLVVQRNGDAYINSFFGYHNVERFVSVVNRHSAPWYFYFGVVLLGFMPWSTYLPAAIAELRLFQRRLWQKSPRSQHLGLLACCWFVSIFGFFTISVTKLPSYVLPLMPAAVILVTLFWNQRLHTNRFDRTLWVSTLVQIGFLTLYTIAFWLLPTFLGTDPAAPQLKQDLQSAGIFWGSALIWGLATGFEVFCVLRRHISGLWLVNAIAFFLFVVTILQPLTFVVDEHRQLPLRQIVQALPQIQQPQEPIFLFGFKKPTVVFYSHQQIGFYWNGNEYLEQWARQPQKSSFLAIVTPRDRAELRLQDYHARSQVLAQQGTYQLLRITEQNPPTEIK